MKTCQNCFGKLYLFLFHIQHHTIHGSITVVVVKIPTQQVPLETALHYKLSTLELKITDHKNIFPITVQMAISWNNWLMHFKLTFQLDLLICFIICISLLRRQHTLYNYFWPLQVTCLDKLLNTTSTLLNPAQHHSSESGTATNIMIHQILHKLFEAEALSPPVFARVKE